jgi:hypothetical protein
MRHLKQCNFFNSRCPHRNIDRHFDRIFFQRSFVNRLGFILKPKRWRHDIQHYDTQHNDTQHNDSQHLDTQHNGLVCDIQHK